MNLVPIRDLPHAQELYNAISNGGWGRIEGPLGPRDGVLGAGVNNDRAEVIHPTVRDFNAVRAPEFG